MIAERTFDADLIKSVLLRQEIRATIAEDGVDEFEPDLDGDIWLAMVKGEVIGVYQLERVNAIMLQIHANVLPEYRKRYSKETGRAALDWILENLPEIHKIVAYIPVLYPNVRDFTASFGFHIEGVLTQSYLKNGGFHDQWVMGVTRKELEAIKWAA